MSDQPSHTALEQRVNQLESSNSEVIDILKHLTSTVDKMSVTIENIARVDALLAETQKDQRELRSFIDTNATNIQALPTVIKEVNRNSVITNWSAAVSASVAATVIASVLFIFLT